MNVLRRSLLLIIPGVVCLTAGFSACQTGSTDYAGRAQTSMVADTVPGCMLEMVPQLGADQRTYKADFTTAQSVTPGSWPV